MGFNSGFKGLSEDIIRKENNPVLVNRRTDWESFRQSLEEKINLMVPLRNEEQLEKLKNSASYRPISLLAVMSKLFEKLLIRRLKPIIERKTLIPNHQFRFRSKPSTIDQVHRITNIVENALEENKVCSAVFLDVAQAFDKLWHEGLNCKLRTILPKQYAEILESYLADRRAL